jgi:hypothetical protein
MAFMFRLEQEDGLPADPPTFKTAVPNWSAGDTIPLGTRMLRVVAIRDDDADQLPALVVVQETDGKGPLAGTRTRGHTLEARPRAR